MNKINTHFNFDPIARRYDLCNHLFSMGVDYAWRRAVVRICSPRAYHHILDLCCGTGDLVFAFARRSDVQHITGLDISPPMILRAQEKQKRLESHTPWLSKRITWKIANAVHTGLEDQSFDFVTCAFGLRNIPDRYGTLYEIRRLLKPEGKTVILEFSLPDKPLQRKFYLLYLKYIMRLGSRILFRDSAPLKYLAQSIIEWNDSFDLPKTAAEAGLELIEQKPMTGGIATLHILRRR